MTVLHTAKAIMFSGSYRLLLGIKSKVLIEITQYQVLSKLLQSNNTENQYFKYPDLEKYDYLYGFATNHSNLSYCSV